MLIKLNLPRLWDFYIISSLAIKRLLTFTSNWYTEKFLVKFYLIQEKKKKTEIWKSSVSHPSNYCLHKHNIVPVIMLDILLFFRLDWRDLVIVFTALIHLSVQTNNKGKANKKTTCYDFFSLKI